MMVAREVIRIDLGGVNCYLIRGTDGFILFDTGGHLVMDKQFSDRRGLLLHELDAAGCTADNLKLIVLTHGDNDHSGNAAYLRERCHTKIAMHSGDRDLVERPTLLKWMESFQYRSLAYRAIFRVLNKTITKVTEKTLDDFTTFSPDIFLEDGFDLSPYGLEATVIHVPGHTKGSIAILTKDGGLIAGDTFANIKRPSSAPNAGDFKQLAVSIDKLRDFSIRTVYPGHGNPFAFEEI